MYSNFACNSARKDESYQIPESAPVEGKGIVLCPCEGNLTVRSSSCDHSVHFFNLQTIQQRMVVTADVRILYR